MKMTKLLASGIAASLAVTSLAAVASATERTFEMGHTQGTIKLKTNAWGKEVSLLADKDGLAPAALGISSDDQLVIDVSNVVFRDGSWAPAGSAKVTNISLAVTGIKGSKSSASKTYTYALGNYWKNDDGSIGGNTYGNSGPLWVLDAYESGAPLDGFNPNQFVEVTRLEFVVEIEKTVTTAKAYDAYGSSEWGDNVSDFGVSGFSTAKDGDILDLIKKTFEGVQYGGYANYSEKSTTDLYPFLPRTDTHLANGDEGQDARLDRDEIWLLSSAAAQNASSGGLGQAGVGAGTDGNQTYDEVDYNKGTNPAHFAGLASQVADFFNKQTNGTITFTFTTSSGATSTAWNVGGVPSSQVGIKNALGDATANDFVLSFNYRQTGSLQALAAVDAAAGEISFDISDVLDALDGKTIGVIDNIYYGSTKGVEYTGDHPYKDYVGFEVQKITLSYDEDETSDNDIEEDDDADDEDDVDDADDADDEDDVDDTDDDDDDDVSVDDDDDTNDDDNNVGGTQNNNDIVTPGADENPNTGVALAVVPAMIAAAAVVVSKKRK